MVSSVSNVVWAVSPTCSLSWRDWGADAVVYDRSSWRTHLLSPLAAATLACLHDSPHTVDDLVALLAKEMDAEPDGALQQAVEAALDEFAERLWIEALTTTTTS